MGRQTSPSPIHLSFIRDGAVKMPLPRITGRELQHPAQGLAESLAASVHNKAGSQAPVSHKASTGTAKQGPEVNPSQEIYS